MIPVFWKRYTCTVSGATIKFVECEECKQRYIYQMSRDVQGQGSSLYLLDNEGAQDRAQDRARAELQEQLIADCDPVPCPKCGWYQTEMIHKLREQHHEWMYWTGLGMLIPVIVCTLYGWACWTAIEPKPVASTFLFSAAGTLLVTALGLILYRLHLARKLEPNACAQSERILAAKGRAESVDDFELWLKQHGIKMEPPAKLT